MPREKIAAKFVGDGSEFHNGIPARSLTEDEFDALSDENKAMLAESKLYDLKHDSPAEAEKAATRVERAAAPSARAESVPAVTSQPVPTPPAVAPASKDDGKK